MKALLVVLGVSMLAATAQADTFRRPGSGCQTKSTTYSWYSFGIGMKNTAASGSFSVACPIDAIGLDASNVTNLRVQFAAVAGSSRPQCTFSVHDVEGSAFWKYTLNAPAAANGFPVVDFGAEHAPAAPPTSTPSLICSIPAGASLLYYTYDDQ